MKKTIFVHVGTHKTGSSAIQRFLTENRERLENYGYKYDFIKKDQINHCSLDFVNEGKALHLDNSFNYIFSCENLYINFEHIKYFLLDKANEFEIKIIIYLRRQDAMKQSVYNQVVKTGFFSGKIYQEHHYNLDYYVFLDKIAQLFSKENIIVRPYEKSQFLGGSIYADFLNVLGIQLSSDFKVDDQVVNPSLSHDGLEYCLYINKLNLPVALRDQVNRMVIKLESVEKHHRIFREHNILSPVRRRKIIEAYAASNSKIAKEYLKRNGGVLFKDPLPDINEAWEPPLPISQEKTYSITKSIYGLNRKPIYNIFKHMVCCSENADSYIEAKDLLLPVFRKVLTDAESNMLEKGGSESDVISELFEASRLIHTITPDNFFASVYDYTPDISSKSVVNGYVELVSIGGDPFFELLKITEELGNVTYIKLTIDSPDKTVAQCFFNTQDNSYYSSDNYVESELNKGLNEVYFIIDNAGFDGQLRIDPGQITGIFKIKEIVVKTGVLIQTPLRNL